MEYLTNYYKNLSEQLQSRLDLLQYSLNEYVKKQEKEYDLSDDEWYDLDNMNDKEIEAIKSQLIKKAADKEKIENMLINNQKTQQWKDKVRQNIIWGHQTDPEQSVVDIEGRPTGLTKTLIRTATTKFI